MSRRACRDRICDTITRPCRGRGDDNVSVEQTLHARSGGWVRPPGDVEVDAQAVRKAAEAVRRRGGSAGEHAHLGRAEAGQRRHCGSGRVPRTQDDRPGWGRATVGSEHRGEAGHVGVVAVQVQLTSPRRQAWAGASRRGDAHRVDRADVPGEGRHLVEQWQHRRLQRHRQRQTGPRRIQGVDEIRQALRRHLDRLIGPPLQAEPGVRGPVQRRGQRVGDR